MRRHPLDYVSLALAWAVVAVTLVAVAGFLISALARVF